MIHAEWSGRTNFAEVAEVVGISTEDVMALSKISDDSIIVVYTKPEDETPTAYSANLKRDKDGILRIWGESVAIPGLIETINRIGDPDDAGF